FSLAEARPFNVGHGIAALPATATQANSKDDLGASVVLLETRGHADNGRRFVPLVSLQFWFWSEPAHLTGSAATPNDLSESLGPFLCRPGRAFNGTRAQANGR